MGLLCFAPFFFSRCFSYWLAGRGSTERPSQQHTANNTNTPNAAEEVHIVSALQEPAKGAGKGLLQISRYFSLHADSWQGALVPRTLIPRRRISSGSHPSVRAAQQQQQEQAAHLLYTSSRIGDLLELCCLRTHGGHDKAQRRPSCVRCAATTERDRAASPLAARA